MRTFEPFPVECLPTAVRDYVVAHARAMDCDESFLALPVLSVLAGAIGNSRRIRLKRAWTEPAIVWTAIVADGGAKKSPPIERAVSFDRETVRQKYRQKLDKNIDRKVFVDTSIR